jgi:putative aldouronate transport system substrate-binding protein
MKTNRFLLPLLVLVLSLSMLLGACQAAPTATPTASATPTAAAKVYTAADVKGDAAPTEDPFGKYAEPVKVTSIHMGNDGQFWFAGTDTIDDNLYTRTYKERLNIEYSFLWTCPGAQAEDKFNTMLAASALPDVLSVSRTQFERLFAAGLVEEITKPVVEYASPFLKKFQTDGYAPFLMATTREDKVFGLANGFSYQDSSDMVWVKKDWLDNLSLSTPTNFTELEAVMKAFVENDPDKNGKNDTVAFTYPGGAQQSYNWGMSNTFFNMFGSYPGITIADGKGGLEDGMLGADQRAKTRAAIVKAAEYYTKGWLDPEYFTYDDAKYQEQLATSKAGVVFGGLWESWWPLPQNLDNDPNANWVPIQIPGVDGKVASTATTAAGITNINIVRKGFEHPEALVKMLNLFHALNNDPATADLATYNVVPADNNQVFLMFPLLIYNPAFNYEGFLAISEAFKSGKTEGMFSGYKQFYDQAKTYETSKDKSGWPAYTTYTEAGCMGVVDKNIKGKNMMFNEYTDEPTAYMVENAPTVKTLYDEMVVKIITGQADIATFDAFTAQYDTLYYNTVKGELDAWFKSKGSVSIQDWFKNS